jgi:hypothetical protein
MSSRRAWRLVGAAVFVGFAIWLTVRSTVFV